MDVQSSSPMSPGRRPFCRQTAVTENCDVADGPVDATLNGNIAPTGHSGFPRVQLVHESSKESLVHTLPNSIARQKKSLQKNPPLQKNQSENCPHSRNENVSKMKQLFAKYVYSAQLAAFDRRLFKQRNSETIRYRQNTSSEEIARQKPEAKKPSRKKDVSDGLPFSSGVLADFKREKIVLAHQKDFSDVLPRETDTPSQQLPAGYCGGVSEVRSRQESRSGLEPSGGERFQNGDIPTIKVNSEEEKCISDTGREKGERFRQSKKSSGYGTGGSDDIPEGEFLSSVFLSSETSVDKEVHREGLRDDHQMLRSPFPNKEVLLCAPNGEYLAEQPKAVALGKGERQLQCRNTDLPSDAMVWQFSGTNIMNMIIPSHIDDNGVDNATRSELVRYFNEIVLANPNIPLPKCELPKFDWNDLEAARIADLISTEEKKDEQFLECVETMASLSSQPWALEPMEVRQQSPDHLSDDSSAERFELDISKESVAEPSLYLGTFSSQDPDSGIRGWGSLDDVDGKMDPPVYPSTGAAARPTPSQQLHDVASANHLAALRIGHSSASARAAAYDLNNEFDTCGISDRKYPQRNPSSVTGSEIHHQLNGYLTTPNQDQSQPMTNGVVTRGAAGFTDQGARSTKRGSTPQEWKTPCNGPLANGFAGPCHRKKSTGYQYDRESDTRSAVVDSGRQFYTTTGMAPTQPLGCGSTGPNYKDQRPSLSQLERSVYCLKRFPHGNCSDCSCLQGKKQVLQLKHSFLNDKIKDREDILRCLWHHSRQCREIQCIVPFCDVYRSGQPLSFEEQFAQMCHNSLKVDLQLELVHAMHKQVRSENFLQLDPSNPISHEAWTRAQVREGQFLGDFGDFNILRAGVEFQDKQTLNVVIKKAVCHPDSKNVYFRINRKSSPYITQDFWCSDLCKENRLLVCSAYYPEMKSLHTVMMFGNLTLDLCLTLLQQVIAAAIHLHSIEIVYLNWKCSNVLLYCSTTDRNHVNIKLCNFSRAVQVKPGSVVTCPADIRETYDPCFTAPEVLCGEALSYNSDVWGIGCLLYEMLYKKPPYSDYCHQSPAQMREMVRRNQLEHNFSADHAQLLPLLCECWERLAGDRCTTEALLVLVAEALLLHKMAQAER
ncbi:uncharacterized protein LOC119730755 [Patiria miniata]|uniref:Protein kinase domain-containing protein n=1 Tax=Patiria miniata TaxID=46514 RepID=A0A914A7D9_PATMI|nr:uncharacterized protein LOC119730755 [Patiria miniata]